MLDKFEEWGAEGGRKGPRSVSEGLRKGLRMVSEEFPNAIGRVAKRFTKGFQMVYKGFLNFIRVWEGSGLEESRKSSREHHPT